MRLIVLLLGLGLIVLLLGLGLIVFFGAKSR